MPCTYYESPREIADREARELEAAVAKKTQELRAELDAATNAACVLAKILAEEKISLKDKKVSKWVKEHQKRDAARDKEKK